jgi:hypothetical protein
LFTNTLSFLSSRNVSDQVSHPYKTTGKIIVLYIHILIFKVLDSSLEDKRFCTEAKYISIDNTAVWLCVRKKLMKTVYMCVSCYMWANENCMYVRKLLHVSKWKLY